MVNKTLRKELWREIRNSSTRFFSIFVMVALGVLFLVGLRSAAPDMRRTADRYFDESSLYDVEVLSTLGLTREDLDAFAEADGVERAVGGWSLDAIMALEDSQWTVKVLSFSDEVNRPTVLEGRLPEGPGECVLDSRFSGFSVGDTVTLTPGEDQTEALSGRSYTVTGFVKSPLYISLDRGTSTLGDGSVSGFVLLPPESFSLDCYTVVDLILSGGAELDAYGADYDSLTGDMTARLETLAEDRAALRYQELRADAQKEIDDGQRELDETVAEAQAEIDNGQDELGEARKTLDEGWGQLEQAELAVSYGWMDQTEYDGLKETLEAGEADYAAGLQALEDARTELETRTAEGQQALDEAREQLSDLKPAEVYVLDRDSNYGFVSYDQNATRMENLARVFPVIFFVVAALVCLTTMTRMVEEQRTQIGSIKAMGYDTGAIAAKYISYGVLAAAGGSALGISIGATLIPWVIFTSYNIMYTLEHLELKLYWGLSLISAFAGIACTVGATLWAMLSTARQTPAVLMRPKAPRVGKRILLERVGPVWRRMSFSMKVSARNLFRYKKRFWMTVIGVAGCTALLIAGLGLRSSIFNIIDIQFGELYRYDVQLTLDDSAPEAPASAERALEESGNLDSLAAIHTRSVTFSHGSATADGYLTVTQDPEALYRQIDLRDMGTKEHIDIPAEGVVIDLKLSELLSVRVGDSITIDCGTRITVPVRGIVEHYVYHYAYMTAGQYETLTGESAAPNEYLVTVRDRSDEAVARLQSRLMTVSGVRGASNLKANARSFRNTIDAVDAAVGIIILSAAALALVVLYNLTNINITERIRELATIKVLGFYDGEVARYVYRENMVLTVLGIALGQVLGKFLCTWLVRTIEMDIVMFGREAEMSNYLLSILLSLLFAVIVNVMMYFRMKKIDMVQSLKSVE